MSVLGAFNQEKAIVGTFPVIVQLQTSRRFFQALLQAVLADPVLLQAVDPRVLQAVLVSAAAVNIDMEQVAAICLRR